MKHLLIEVATYPGRLVRESIRQLVCAQLKLAVVHVRYFDLSSDVPPSFVIHEQPKGFASAVWLCLAPWVVALVLGLALSVSISFILNTGHAWAWIFPYLGVSMLYQGVPADEDLEAALRKARGGVWRFFMNALSLLSRIWPLRLVYALAVALGLPVLAVELWPM